MLQVVTKMVLTLHTTEDKIYMASVLLYIVIKMQEIFSKRILISQTLEVYKQLLSVKLVA